jgi:hypothetical protein
MIRRLQAGILLACIYAVAAYAQVTTASISGFVLDPSGKPIKGATVTVSDPRRSSSRTATTDMSGFYKIIDLAPASYMVSGEASQFVKTQAPLVQLEVNEQARVDFHLPLEGQKASVTIESMEAAVATESSELSTVIDQSRVDGLPLNERDFLQLALLTPGVAPPVQGSQLSTRGGFAMHANGGREEFNNFLLDGADNNDQDVNRYVMQPSVDAIQEFRIATNAYSAEYGRNAGAQVNVITRSGTNQLHGFAYDYLRNRVLDSTNSFDPGNTAKLIRNQFGGGAGGAVVKNRAFYFVDIDALRGQQGIPQYGSVPTLAERAGNFAGQPVVDDPFTGLPFPNNIIPASRISPLSADMLAMFPLPNAANVNAAGNYYGQPVEPESNTQFNARLDYSITDMDRLSLRYSYEHNNLFEPYTLNSSELPGFGDYVYDRGHNAMARYERAMGPTTFNSLMIALSRAPVSILPQNYQTNVNQLWGVNYLPTLPRDFGFPYITVAGFSPVGDGTDIPIERAETTYQAADTVSLVRGAHTLKLGGEVRRIDENGILDYYARGSVDFAGAFSGSGVGDLLLGFPTYSIQAKSNNPQAQRTTSLGLFVQDDWKVSQRLTLNLGLRWEFNSPPVDAHNNMSSFDLATGMVEQVGTNGLSRSGLRPDYTNFAPRVGFAYSLNSKTVIRGGYGIFYDAGTLTVNSALYFNPPYFNVYTFFPSATSLLGLSNPFSPANGVLPPASLSTLSPDITTSYLQSWNLNLQRDIHKLGVLSVAYAGSKGTHLIRSLDLNQPPPGSGPLTSREPYPQYSNIFFTESGGDSSYNSLQVSLSRRLTQGLTFLAVYTFSRSIDDTSAFLANAADPNFPQDSHNYHLDRGLSSFDMKHRAVIGVVYSLPFRNAVLRNLESSSIVTLQSGQPFTPLLNFDNSNTGNTGQQSGSDRPNLVGNPSLPDPSANLWFNTSAFAIPPPYTFGSAGRNILIGPGLATVDLSLSRRFHFGERASALLGVQAFNMLNRENLNLPQLYAGTPSFGQIFSAKPPRQVQMVLRFSF